jgi:hypothetical protein
MGRRLSRSPQPPPAAPTTALDVEVASSSVAGYHLRHCTYLVGREDSRRLAPPVRAAAQPHHQSQEVRMPKLQFDGAFRTQVLQLVQDTVLNDNWVGVVSRWDLNNNWVWYDESLANGQTVVPGGGAAHAEEVMIKRWTERLHAAGIYSPTTVEIFLSRSPCVDRSHQRQFMGTVWPIGCINKFHALINIETDVQSWIISFLNYYQEGFAVDARVYAGVAVLNDLPRVQMYWWRDVHDSL